MDIINGTIKNIKIVNSTISGYQYVGGIVGYNEGNINNCANESRISTNSVSGGSYTAGICGYSENGIISSCYNYGEINGEKTYSVAGIIGVCTGGTIKNCYNNGTIIAEGESGGICGRIENKGKILNCYNSATITANSSGNGGIVGKLYNSILNNCYNVGNIECQETKQIGGITGIAKDNSNISNSYNTAQVIGNSGVGGILGDNQGATSTIEESFNTGNISSSSQSANLGAIVGYSNSSDNIINCQWFTDSANYGIGYINSNDGATYNENIDMKNILLVVNSESAFVEDDNNINNGYPILYWQCDPTMDN